MLIKWKNWESASVHFVILFIISNEIKYQMSFFAGGTQIDLALKKFIL